MEETAKRTQGKENATQNRRSDLDVVLVVEARVDDRELLQSVGRGLPIRDQDQVPRLDAQMRIRIQTNGIRSLVKLNDAQDQDPRPVRDAASTKQIVEWEGQNTVAVGRFNSDNRETDKSVP